VRATPASVLKMFEDSSHPAPTEHRLSDAERTQVKAAIDALPPFHRRVLNERLRVLSFLDGMPNTALTSTVNPKDPFRLFDITVNAAILRQNASEWLTQKERTCFDAAGSTLSVSIDAGTRVDALLYVLLHEATHVVDMAERITPDASDEDVAKADAKARTTAFTQGIWNSLSIVAPRFREPLLLRVRFYTQGAVLPVDQAQAVYESLQRTPFVSLYGGRNWKDDLAEYVAVYHVTEVLKQPFRIVVRSGDAEVFVYEPMKSPLVRERVGQMKQFYDRKDGKG
jgi:hypothetical protein